MGFSEGEAPAAPRALRFTRALKTLIRGRDEIAFNLFYLIRDGENPLLFTDEKTYLLAQSNDSTPLWAYIAESADDGQESEIADFLVERLQANPRLRVSGQTDRLSGVLARASERSGIPYRTHMPMNAYACFLVKPRAGSGHMVMPAEKWKPDIASLIAQMAQDADEKAMSSEEAARFANAMVPSETLFLWEDHGKIVSMARISHRTDRYARINTVVTDRSHRSKGYAGLLVGAVCQRIIDGGQVPMLYADARNPASNAAYQRIGFEKQRGITEYAYG